MADRGTIQIRVLNTKHDVATIKAFRQATHVKIAAIQNALTRHAPLLAAQLFGRDHEQTEQKLKLLLNELDQLDSDGYTVDSDTLTWAKDQLGNA